MVNTRTAVLCKPFGDRVRNYPARVRFSWFHLTTEWPLGLSLVVFSLLLAVFGIGIQLPGGGDLNVSALVHRVEIKVFFRLTYTFKSTFFH